VGKPKVLFLCTGNSARSQMAEALLRYYADPYFDVYSAGLEPKGINPFTRRIMEEIGLDLQGQYSKSVSEYLGKETFAYLVTVCAHAERNCPTTFLGFGRRLHWYFDDPAAVDGTDEEKIAKFREVRNQIEHKILDWLLEQGLTPGTEKQEAEAA
jgi:arsenate reductase (thioredoxin)